MTVLTHPRNRHRRWLAWLVGLAALILPLSLLTTAAASAAQHSAAPASRCTAAYLTSALHLSHVTVDSAAPDTSGSYTPPGTTTPITGLPDFCDVALTQTDSAGNPMHIAVWLPAKWNGRFQGIGGGGYSCGSPTPAPEGLLPPCRRPSRAAMRGRPPTAGCRRLTGPPAAGH